MVPTEIRQAVEDAFSMVRRTPFNVNEYVGGDLQDVAFDIASCEAHLAGIAHSLLHDHQVRKDAWVPVLDSILVEDTWTCVSDGGAVRLRDEGALRFAELLESLRGACVRWYQYLGTAGSGNTTLQ